MSETGGSASSSTRDDPTSDSTTHAQASYGRKRPWPQPRMITASCCRGELGKIAASPLDPGEGCREVLRRSSQVGQGPPIGGPRKALRHRRGLPDVERSITMRCLTHRSAAVLAAGALIIAGCGDTDEPIPDSELDPAAVDETDIEEATIDDPEPDDAEPASEDLNGPEHANGWQYIEEYEDDFVAEDSGVRLSVITLIINDVTSEDYVANPQLDDD